MLKKNFFAAVLSIAILLTGCGEEKSSQVEMTPEFGADKAIIAYAQLYACAAPDDPKAAGFTDEFVDKQKQAMFASFGKYPFSEQTLQAIAKNFSTTLKSRMNFKATLKSNDAAHPVIELTANPADFSAAFKDADKDADLLILRREWGELQAYGLSDDAIKKDAAFQKLAVDSMSKYLGKIPLKPESTLEVTCKVAVGADGKFYWSPEKPEAVSKFVSGQK
ncbi:MAG: hypothetical protein IJ685_07525 [Selenomonadaceae bacterium]|nr:hypothetical protein [Selenomonadaceae bacterium]